MGKDGPMIGPSSRPIPSWNGTGTHFQNQERDGTRTETKGTSRRKIFFMKIKEDIKRNTDLKAIFLPFFRFFRLFKIKFFPLRSD